MMCNSYKLATVGNIKQPSYNPQTVVYNYMLTCKSIHNIYKTQVEGNSS